MNGAPGSRRWRRLLILIQQEATPYVRRRLAQVLGLVLVGAVVSGLAPLALKWIVDGLSIRGRVPAAAWLLLALYASSQWMVRSAGELRALIYARAERRILRRLSEQTFGHLLSLPLRFHLSRQTGAVGQTLDSGLEGLRMVLRHLVFTVLPVCAELTTSAIVLWRLDQPVFLILFCLAGGCYAFAFGHSAGRIARAAREATASRIKAGGVVTDGLLNFEAIKCYGAEELLRRKAGRALAHSERAWLVFHKRYARNGLIVALVFGLFLAATLAWALREVHLGLMSVGGFVLVNTYMLQLVRPAEMLGYAVQGVSHGAALFDQLLTLLDERPQLSTGGAVRAGSRGAIEFDRVTLSYRSRRTALVRVSFAVAAGDTLGIVGESGAGKSSVLRLLLRLVEPDQGVIRLDGAPLTTIAPAALRHVIAVVLQDTVLLDDTIEYNIAIGCPHCNRREIERAAQLAQLHEFIRSLPKGYATVVGERGVRLSGGERQRIAIARAALRRPLIYVFDEATASLDARTERSILDSLREASRTATTLVIAHRLTSVISADSIVVLHGGQVAETGTHEALLRASGRYAALWAAQRGGVVAA